MKCLYCNYRLSGKKEDSERECVNCLFRTSVKYSIADETIKTASISFNSYVININYDSLEMNVINRDREAKQYKFETPEALKTKLNLYYNLAQQW